MSPLMICNYCRHRFHDGGAISKPCPECGALHGHRATHEEHAEHAVEPSAKLAGDLERELANLKAAVQKACRHYFGKGDDPELIGDAMRALEELIS